MVLTKEQELRKKVDEQCAILHYVISQFETYLNQFLEKLNKGIVDVDYEVSMLKEFALSVSRERDTFRGLRRDLMSFYFERDMFYGCN